MAMHANNKQDAARASIFPALVKTSCGIEFDPSQDLWSFRDELAVVHMDFKEIRASETLIAGAKTVLIWYAENLSAASMQRCFDDFRRFCNVVADDRNSLSTIEVPEVLSYRASLGKKKSWMLATISKMFRRWHELGIPGVSSEVAQLLTQLRIPGMEKGVAVLTMDTKHGPFTDIEFQSIQNAAEDAYLEGRLTLSNYVMAALFMALGLRPVQCAALKVCDVGVNEATDGSTIYILRVPRAKQRGQLARSQFKERVLISKIGSLLKLHASNIELQFTGRIHDPQQAPLFPAYRREFEEPAGFEFHRTGASISQSLSNTLSTLNVVSERTGKLINITPYRFRRTIGTKAAMEGHGELVIAELLDHTDTQNVGVYVQATPEIVKRIDRALAMHMAPLAQAFSGVIISDESEATRKNDPASRICDPRFDPTMKPMGNCGKYGFCDSLAPIACYTCRSFEPWLDGPHEAVLNHLIAERDRLMAGSDTRIASINDRTILAVAEVVRRCQETKSGAGDSTCLT